MDVLLVVLLVLNLLVAAAALIVALLRRGGSGADAGTLRDAVKAEQQEAIAAMRSELQAATGALRQDLLAQRVELAQSVRSASEAQLAELAREREARGASSAQLREELGASAGELKKSVEERLELLRQGNEAKLEKVRETVDEKLQGTLKTSLEENAQRIQTLTDTNVAKQAELRQTLSVELEKLRQGNEAKLEKMRETVDEKLQGTLEKRLGESFSIVSERLEQVQKGLGEMQTLASDVGGLKRVLTNVKSRGGWGEVQLQRQLEDMLTPEQYAENVAIRPDSGERVEFAVRLPGRSDDDQAVWLPIDSKFPQEDYERLLEAQEQGDKGEIDAQSRNIERVILQQAKLISDKYVHPPFSTDFGIMYLPTEGLFAEVVRRPGLVSKLQNELRITVAGPTVLTALLNSLQLGFRTLAIEKRSSEVWKVLSAAKVEFQKYGQVWEKLGKQLQTAQNTVTAAGTRTRAIERKLRAVETLDLASGEPSLLEEALPDALAEALPDSLGGADELESADTEG